MDVTWIFYFIVSEEQPSLQVETIRSLGPAVLPLVAVTAFVAFIERNAERQYNSNKESTEKQIKATENQINLNKENTEKQINSNKENTEKQITAMRELNIEMIKAYEARIENIFNRKWCTGSLKMK